MELKACVRLRPESLWGQNTYALALSLSGKSDEALKALNQVVEADPEFFPARLHRAVAYLQKNNTTAALRDLDFVLNQPDDRRLLEAAYYRALICLGSEDYPAALRDLDELLKVKIKKNFLPGYLARAQANFLTGQDERALGSDVERLLVLAPDVRDAKEEAERAWRRGWVLRRIADKLKPANVKQRVLELARSDLEKAAPLLGTPDAYAELGSVLHKLGKRKDAITWLSKGLESSPDDLRLLTIRGEVYRESRQQEKALDDFRRVTNHQPTNRFEIIKVAWCHFRLGWDAVTASNRHAAESHLAQALTTLQVGNADYYLLQHNLACIYAELAELDEENRPQHQLAALRLIRSALRVAERTSAEARADELDLIRTKESSFNSLRGLPEYQKLLEN